LAGTLGGFGAWGTSPNMSSLFGFAADLAITSLKIRING
jgi:hypothetical protein